MTQELSKRRSVCKMIGAASLGAALPQAALAQDSRRPTTMVVPYAAGGGTDLFARFFADAIGTQSGARMIVENRAGANGAIGLLHVAAAPPDGRTLAYTYGNLALLQVHSMKNPPVHILRDLTPVIRTVTTQAFVLVSSQSKWTSLAQFIDDARRNPGKYTYADYGELTIAAIMAATGIQLTRVAYKGGGPAQVDVMAGTVDIVANAAAQTMSNIRGGKLRALALTEQPRMQELPDVPTIREVVPKYDLTSYQGIFAPKDTPANVVEEIYERVAGVLKRPEVQREVAARFAVPAPMTPTEFRAFMERDSLNVAAILRAGGIEPR
ncbi:MAG: Bug family tripartite tricarboxylate transporter substrate binding protein [Burkholderiaceae bacterium]